MKKLCFLLTFIICSHFSSQILNQYPKGQDDYNGGNEAFYRDFHNIILQKNLKPCENKNEFYILKLLVNTDGSINYVKPDDVEEAENNKCTIELAKNVIKYMWGWKSATIGGQKMPALTSFIIFPDDLFDKFKTGYDAAKILVEAQYETGLKGFREDIIRRTNIKDFRFRDDVKILIGFDIDKDGKMSNVHTINSSGSYEFDEAIMKNIRMNTGKWLPAKFHNVSVKTGFRLPITISAR